MLGYSVSGNLRGHHYYLSDHANTNKGDYAISIAVEEQFAKILQDENIDFELVKWGSLDPDAIDEINRASDLFVISGSGYLHFSGAETLNDWVIRDIKLLELIQCPVLLYGIGVNIRLDHMAGRELAPSPESRAALGALGALARGGITRDPVAARLLNEAGGQTRVSIDPAFLLERPPRHGVQPGGGALRIGLNFAVHGPGSWSSFKRNLPVYARSLASIQRRTGARYRYFLHSEPERVAYRLLRAAGIEAELVDLPPRELATAYGDLDLHIAQMMHSAILCASAGTPLVSFAYDFKTKLLFDLLGLPEHCQLGMDWKDSDIIENVDLALQSLDSMRRRLATARDTFEHQFAENAVWLRSLLAAS
ncbi:MAG: polysaccharide pyruvyl transferase family protein [Tistlia sp.]|uniref:polysaccharide pyruvyl transferase family protein n=1 Tax=Tistlia sp. TaxID=3057121 RepID=UPI0034A1DF3A